MLTADRSLEEGALGFEEQTELDKLTLTVPQLALLPYGLVGFAATFLAFPCGMLPGGELGFLAFIVGPLLFVVGTMYAPSARIELTGSELRLDAWAGWPFPRPSQLRLPLHRVTATWGRPGTQVNKREVRGLTLAVDGGEPIYLPALRISRSEHDLLTERIEGMRVLAEMRHGMGEAEVPDELTELAQGSGASTVETQE
mgnify:CR=1 FL=1